MADFKPIETQEDFDAAIRKRLEQKEREVAGTYKDYLAPEAVEALKADHAKALDELQRQLTAAKETAAKHDQIVADLTARASKAEAGLLKTKIAHENGVPIELADRLIGSSEDELKADAAKMAGYLKPASAPPMRSYDPAVNNGGKPQLDQALMGVISQLAPPVQ